LQEEEVNITKKIPQVHFSVFIDHMLSLLAVRDDRSPGGKNRNKRQRLEDIPGLINPDGTLNIIPENLEPEEDYLMAGLVQAKPDLIPKFDSGNF